MARDAPDLAPVEKFKRSGPVFFLEMPRLLALREHYCYRCRNTAVCSTGTRLLVQRCRRYVREPVKLLDYGCTVRNFRNTQFICEHFRVKYAVRCDVTPASKPDVVCYPTMLPFRDNVFNVVLFSHILMFLESKDEWRQVAAELRRVVNGVVMAEVYHCVGKAGLRPDEKPLQFTSEEFKKWLSEIGRVVLYRSGFDGKLEVGIVKRESLVSDLSRYL